MNQYVLSIISRIYQVTTTDRRSQTDIRTGDSAVSDADVVYTDVWISMGQEDRRDKRLGDFEGFQVNEELLDGVDVKVMHCLPAHRGEEIAETVLESERSIVFEQVENRLHAQKALLIELLEE